MELKFSPLL